MDSDRFDALTRVLSSRRTALASILGGVAALLGLAGSKEAAAHNPIPACQLIADPVTRRRCLQRAQVHNRRHRCKPKRPVTLCNGRCSGTVFNNCGKRVNCPSCPAGKICTSNHSCAQTCPTPDTQVGCPGTCYCFGPVVGGGNHCVPLTVDDCDEDIPTPCATNAQCLQGQSCIQTSCGPGDTPENRCVPLCTA